MALKRLLKNIQKANPTLTASEERKKQPNGRAKNVRKHPIKRPKIIEELPPLTPEEHLQKKPPGSQAQKYKTIEVSGSTGKRYKIAVPASIHVPLKWEWDETKFRVAQMIADGYPIAQIADTPGLPSRNTIYAWLEHPEFREHVDGLVMETGFANKRERIAGLSKVAKKLFDKIIDEFEHLDLTDKNTGAVLTGLTTVLKQLAQEKEEFIEESKITQDTNIRGNISVDQKIELLLNKASEDERKALENEFDSIGDDIIRNIVGGSE